MGQIIAIIFGCTVLLAILSMVCAYRTRRRIATQQRLISSAYNSGVPPRNVYAPGAQGNGRMNAARTPYTVPVTSTAPTIVREDEPPSYQDYMSTAKP